MEPQSAAGGCSQAAGIAIRDRVLVGSDLHPERASILREAIRRAGWAGPTVYVGDGAWDLRAARELALPFLGVDADGNEALRRAGVRHVVAGYADVPAFLAALAGAASCGPTTLISTTGTGSDI